jgi:heme O synthase-like polyprenyltransferase
MLTTALPDDKAVKGIQAALIVLIASSYMLTPWAGSPSYVAIITAMNVPLLAIGRSLSGGNPRKSAWRLFKLSAPYIVLLFSAFMVSHVI